MISRVFPRREERNRSGAARNGPKDLPLSSVYPPAALATFRGVLLVHARMAWATKMWRHAPEGFIVRASLRAARASLPQTILEEHHERLANSPAFGSSNGTGA